MLKLIDIKKQKTKKLIPRLTPQFLETLKEAVQCCGWEVDFIESADFVVWCHKKAGEKLEVTELEAYEYGY